MQMLHEFAMPGDDLVNEKTDSMDAGTTRLLKLHGPGRSSAPHVAETRGVLLLPVGRGLV
jgi:hypothetical protein